MSSVGGLQIQETEVRWDCNAFIDGKEVFVEGQPLSIVFLNGIMNTADDIVETGKTISSLYKQAKVICIGDPTQGFALDVWQAACFAFGMTSPEILDRAILTWKHTLDQMDEKYPGREGKIIHIAHSKGGLTTERALERLSELSKTNPEYKEIKNRISIHIYGSPAKVKQSCFDVTYYVQDSVFGDPVPYLAPFKGSMHHKTDQTTRCLPSQGVMKHGILGEVYQEAMRHESASISNATGASCSSKTATAALRQRTKSQFQTVY